MITLDYSYLFEPEGNACSLTDSTAEEHVLALVEHAADEARDRINRYMPNSKVLHYEGDPWGGPKLEHWQLLPVALFQCGDPLVQWM